MIDLICPNCKRTIQVRESAKEVICPKCLETSGVSYIMVESKQNPKPRYLGGGLFEQPRSN